MEFGDCFNTSKNVLRIWKEWLVSHGKNPRPAFLPCGVCIYSIHGKRPSSCFKPFNIVARIIYRVDIQNRFTGRIAGSKSIILYLMLCGHTHGGRGCMNAKKKPPAAGRAARFVLCGLCFKMMLIYSVKLVISFF